MFLNIACYHPTYSSYEYIDKYHRWLIRLKGYDYSKGDRPIAQTILAGTEESSE